MTCCKLKAIISDDDKTLHVLVQTNSVSHQLPHYNMGTFTIGLVPQMVRLGNKLSSIF